MSQTIEQLRKKIETLYKERNSEELINLYNADPSKFISHVAGIYSKRDEIRLVKYLESLNLDLNNKGKHILWEALKSNKIKTSTYLIKHLDYDSEQAIFCNKIFISSSCLSEKVFEERKEILKLIFTKISSKTFSDIAATGNHNKEILSKIEKMFFELHIPITNENQIQTNKKLKI